MEYKNFTKKKCTVRLFKEGEKLPFQVTHFNSVKKAYTYLTNLAYDATLVHCKYQVSNQFSLTTFRNYINQGFAKGFITTECFLEDERLEILEKYKFTAVLQ